jgi:hypothetical protein
MECLLAEVKTSIEEMKAYQEEMRARMREF